MVFFSKRRLGRFSGSICVALGGSVAAESILRGIHAGDWRSSLFGGVVGGMIAWVSYRSMLVPKNIRVREMPSNTRGDSHA